MMLFAATNKDTTNDVKLDKSKWSSNKDDALIHLIVARSTCISCYM